MANLRVSENNSSSLENCRARANYQNLILASQRASKSGASMWHAYITEQGKKVAESEFWFYSPLKCLRYMLLLRKRSGAIIPKAVFNKVLAAHHESKAQAESAPQAEQTSTAQPTEPTAPTAQAVGEVEPSQEVEQAKYFAQYKEMKAKHENCVLLFRVKGDYVTFGDDCEVVKAVCGASSFAHSALDWALPKLVRAGKRVAICDDITK